MGLLVLLGWVREANKAPAACPRETVMNQTVSDTIRYNLIDEDAVQVNGT